MYNKKVLSKIDLGKQTKKDPFKGDIIYDSMGQWKFPGQPTRIPSNEITMEGVPYPVYGIDNTGYEQMMYPGEDYTFPGNYVDEYPMAKKGGSLPKRPKKKNKKAWSRSIEATNILFTENPLFSQPKPRRNKVYDPNAKYFQEGGELPDDYQEFLDYSATAPENRQPGPGYFYGSPDEYDHYGMWEALGKPNSFEEALEMNPDWQQDEEGYYHGYSVNPYTGVFLKAGAPGLEEGDTKWMEIKDHYLSSRANESTPVYDTDLQRFKYVPNKQKGGTKSKSKRTKLPTLYISDPEEYRLRKAMYDDSLYMYQQNNSTKLPPPPKLEYDGPRGGSKHSPVKVTTDPIKKITDKNDTKIALLYSKAFPGDSPAFKNYQKKTGKKLPANLPMWIEKQTALYYPNYHYSNTNPTGKGFVPPGKDYVKEHQYRGLWKEPRQPVMFGEPESSVVTSTTYDEYPPIYVSDSNDPRIGMYTEAGNQILYKKPVTSKKNALKLKPKVAESKIPISESAPVSTQVPVQTENVLPIQKPLRDKMILPLGRSYSNEATDGSLEGGKTTYGQFEKAVDPRTGKIRYLPTGKKSNFITLEDPTFKEGGKLGPISLNSGKYAAKKYPFGKFSGVFTKQDGGYIETELTDAEIEEYRKGGFIVEDISVPTLTKTQKGGETSCPEGYIYDSANNTCIPTGEFEYIDDPNDARLQDYKMQDILYRYSQLPYKHKDNLTAEDILSGDLNTSWNERLNDHYLSNEEKALLKNDLLDWEGSKAQVWNFNDKKQLQNFINSSAFTWAPNLDYTWQNDEELTGLIKKYPPTGYHAREYFSSYPYTDTYAYNQNVPNKSGYNHYVTPKTAFIEDEIDREKLKKIYPTLTDEEIDEHLKETRDQPSYITNYLQAPHYYWNIKNNDVEYREDQAYPLVERITPEEISNSHNPWQYEGLPKKGADSYLQESETDNIQYQGDYIPTWSAPKKRYILRGAVPKPVVSESIQTEDVTSTQMPLKDKMVLPLGRHYFNENINKGLQGGQEYYGEFEKIIDPSSGKVRYVPTGKKSKFRTLYDPTFQLGGIPMAEYGMPMGSGMSQNYMGRTKTLYQTGGRTLPKPRAKNYDPLYTIEPQVAESTAVRNLPKQDKKVVEKAIAKKEAERKVVAQKIQANPLLTQAQKDEILLDPRKLDENVNLAYEKGPDTIQQVEPQSTASRAWEYITNPLTAAEYAISGGGAENMPRNINEMRMAGIDPGVVAGRNLVGNTLNYTTNLFDAGDKVVRNVGKGNYEDAALEALRFLPGARLSTGLGKQLGTKTGLLSNAYKVNPFAFKPNPKAYYRGIGKEGLEDAVQSGVFRQAGFDNKNYNNYKGVWYATGDRGLAKARDFAKDYIAEVPRTAFPETGDEFFGSALFPTRATQRHIPIEEGRILQKDWLRGYKEVPTSLPGSPNATSEKIGYSLGVPKNNEIKNINYFQQLLDNTSYSAKDRNFLQGVVNSVKKQNNMASDKQFEILQGLKSGNSNYGKKGYSLTSEEILKLPAEEILNKTGRSKEDWELLVEAKPDKLGKVLEDTYNSAYNPTEKQLANIEAGKQQLLDFYSSSEYNRRLQNAIPGLSFMDAYNYQNNLINAINKTKPRYVQSKNYGTLESDAMAYTSGADASGTKLGIDFSSTGLNRSDAKYLSSHEYGHASLYDDKNKKLLENLPELKLDPNTLNLWKAEAAKPGGESYSDLIKYYGNPDEARQRGINAILYSKEAKISIDDLVDMPYDEVISLNRAGKIPSDIVNLRQLYDQKELKSYLKKLYTIVAPTLIGAEVLQQEQDGGFIETELTPKEIKKYRRQGYIIEEI
jgi:hypothetical protein